MKSYTCLLGVLMVGCSAGGQHFDTDDNGSDGAAPCKGCDAQVSPQYDGSNHFGDSASDAFNDGSTGVTTVYANTDDTLYSLDPSTNAITTIGTFAGMGGTTYDSAITDLAVDATGNVYVNTETVVYSAVLPTTLPGTVQLTKLAAIAVATDQSFYALAFAPAGALGTGEVLIGGDGDGELYSISTTNGATQDLGSFGTDPSHSGYDFTLSGDLVFYMDAHEHADWPRHREAVQTKDDDMPRHERLLSRCRHDGPEDRLHVEHSGAIGSIRVIRRVVDVRRAGYGLRRSLRVGRVGRQCLRVRAQEQLECDAAPHLDRHDDGAGERAVIRLHVHQRLVRCWRDDDRHDHRAAPSKLTSVARKI